MIPYYILSTINVGPFILHTWGLFAGLAFAAALFIALREAKRKNISEDNIFDLAMLVLFGGVVGARTAYILENWNYFSQNRSEILDFKEGGLMFFGGAIGAIILVGIYLKKKKLNYWNAVDCLAPSFAIGELIGRIGCALSDLHIGTKTSLPWAQAYTDGSLRHPIAIYMALNGLVMFAGLWFLRKKIRIRGALFLIFVLWYSGTRFFLDFLRCSDLDVCDPRYSGYTPSQYASAAVFIFSLIILINKYKKYMAEQQNGNGENENKGLGDSVVSFTEIEEVVFEGNDAKQGAGAGWKNKLSAAAKSSWMIPLALIIALVLGAAGASVYYKKMYYGKMFEKSPFAFQGKTWVSYDDPIVKMTIINDSKCASCNAQPIVDYLKSGLASTFSVEEVNFDSQAGKDMIAKFGINFLPAFVFDSRVKDLKNLKEATPEELGQTFNIKDDKYYLNPAVVSSISGRIGIELGRFIESPKITTEDRIKGPETAPVTIIEFCDFKSLYCKQESGIVNQVLADYPGKVRLVYKHLPSSAQPEAQFAAEAAECAGEQGKFFEMADTFFAKQDKLDPASITRYVWNLRLDAKKFKECTDSGKYKAKVANDAQVASEFGIGNTPALFIGDEFFPGGISLDQLKAIIDARLAK